MKHKGQKKKGNRTSRGRWIWRFLMLVAVTVFVVAAWQLFTLLTEYRQAAQEYENLEQYVVTESDSMQAADAKDEGPDIDFDSLQAQYEDLIGWLVVEALDLSYPIMQSDDNDYYLHRTTEGTYNFAGSIFLDCANSPDFSDCNSLIYGHNMKDGSMFGSLKKFRQEEVYGESMLFWVCTPERNYQYQIFSAYETAVGSDTYTLFSGSGTKFREYLEEMASRTEIPTGTFSFDGTEHVVTLSTCTGNSSTRFVVQGVRYGE